MKFIFSTHAEIELKRRKIEKENVANVIKNPQQKFRTNDKWVYQSKYFDVQSKKEMLLRVFIKEGMNGLKIITAYKTSKIKKYWRP